MTKFFVTSEIPTNSGVQQTMLYDLKVFNYLVMRLDTDRAWEMKAKFNDVLVERETGVTQGQHQPQPQIFRSKHLLFVSVRLYCTSLGFFQES